MIIAFNGFKRHGKNTAAAFAAELLDEQFQTCTLVGFADKLKLAAARALGFHNLDAAGAVALMDQFKENGTLEVTNPDSLVLKLISGREYLQWFGTEVGRDVFGENFWVDQVLPAQQRPESEWAREAVHRKYGTDHVLVTDCRFPNEAQRVKDLGGKVIEVFRPALKGASDAHSSEKPLPGGLVDYLIVNDTDLGTLRMRVEQALGSFGVLS
jgi:hypothetical protein